MSETQPTTPAETPNPTTPEVTPTPTKSEATPTSSPETTKETGKPSLLNEPDKDTKTEDKKEETKAPEKYEAFKVPDGFELDEAVATQAGEVFKELNLSQEQGQKLVDFYTKLTQEAFDAPFNQWLDQQETWQKEIKEDPEIGGKMTEVKATTRKFVDSIGDPKLAEAFREAMDFTGAGNNPAFVRLFYKLAQKYTEGTHVAGKGPTDVKSPVAPSGTGPQAMYPNLPRT